MVNGSGNCGLAPGTHFQSSLSAFQRWTCESTILPVLPFCGVAGGVPVASAAPAPTVALTKLRRVSMEVLPASRRFVAAACVVERTVAITGTLLHKPGASVCPD